MIELAWVAARALEVAQMPGVNAELLVLPGLSAMRLQDGQQSMAQGREAGMLGEDGD